jgi:hypothetical protein
MLPLIVRTSTSVFGSKANNRSRNAWLPKYHPLSQGGLDCPCGVLAPQLRADSSRTPKLQFELSQSVTTHHARSDFADVYRRLQTPFADSAVGKVGGFKPTAEVWNAWEAAARDLPMPVVICADAGALGLIVCLR